MVQAFFLSVAQLGDRRILGVLLKSLLLTIVVLAALGVGVWCALAWLAAHWALGTVAQQAAGIAAGVLTVLAAGVLFRAIALLIVGLFADEIVMAVEAKHYATKLSSARKVPVARSLAMGLASAGRFVVVNVALLPLYLILLATGIGPAILFFLVNGWLLGRDLGDMVAVRHLAPDALPGWRGSTAVSRFALGLIGTALFVLPVVNLAAPVISAAMATHWFHRRRT
jgi:CysZ protein